MGMVVATASPSAGAERLEESAWVWNCRRSLSSSNLQAQGTPWQGQEDASQSRKLYLMARRRGTAASEPQVSPRHAGLIQPPDTWESKS